MSDASEKKTLVEEGTEFKGSLTSKCPVEVRGKVEGDLAAPSLHVSDSGAVHGKVRVERLESSGEISGEFDADAIHLSGVVKDNTVIRAKTLEVRLAPPSGNKMQVIFGEVAIDVGDAPAKEASSGKKKGREKEEDNKSVPPPG